MQFLMFENNKIKTNLFSIELHSALNCKKNKLFIIVK